MDDRIAQSAAAGLLIEAFESEFSRASFAYRLGLGPKQASDRLAAIVSPTRWVVIADIEKFFDNVDHATLIPLLRAKGVDPAALRLFQTWLQTPSLDRETRFQPMKGLPQGTPVAPVLANIYLTGFDRALEAEGWQHVRYADDFVIMADDRIQAEAQLRFVRSWLTRERHLAIKDTKTLYTSVIDGFSFVGFWFDAAGRSLGVNKSEAFKTALRAALSEPGQTSLPGVIRRHNDLVVGWRNYYGGVTDRLDQQLEDLDRWRAESCAEYVASIGADATLAPLCFASLAPPRPASVEGSYPEWEAWPSPPDSDLASFEDDASGSASTPSRARVAHPFSSARQLRAQEIGARQIPAALEDGTLWIPTFGSFVTMTKSVLVVRLKKQTLFECPIEIVDQVVVEADGVAVSSRAITACARRRIPLVFRRNSGLPAARLVPGQSDFHSGLADLQMTARNTAVGAAIARAMISAKIRNQRSLLLRVAKYRGRPDHVRATLRAAAATLATCVERCDSIADTGEWRHAVLVNEARAAAWYWRAFSAMMPADLSFRGRHGRGAADLVNVLLNYGYWLLYQRVWLAIERTGLFAFVGLLHAGRHKAPGLVLDLMEEFRQPVVDRALLALIGRKAALRLNEDHRLSLRSRRRATAAFTRAMARRDRGIALADRITKQAAHLSGALAGHHPYTGYRSRW